MSFPTNPTNGQIYKNYQYNSINQTWNTISTKNNIQKTGYFNTGDIRELCRIPFTNLGACVRVTLFATRGDYVVVATWLITTGHASGCQITKQNGTYIVPSLCVDVDNYSTMQISISFGSAQSYFLSVESYGSEVILVNEGTIHSSPDSGYTRYIS